MPAQTPSTPLKHLIHLLAPHSASDPALTNELEEYAREILDSNLAAPALGNEDMLDLAGLIKRHLIQSHTSSTPALRFSNLFSRLQDQPTLSHKYPVLYFLYVLSQQSSTPAAPISRRPSSSIPSLNPRPPNGSFPAPPPIPPAPSHLKSKASLLQAYRLRIGHPHIPTPLLLRDAIYLLQGISGSHVRFSTIKSAGLTLGVETSIEFIEGPEGIIPKPTREQLLKIAELGHLYRLITGFLNERALSKSVGLIEQSLHHELRSQLTEYHKLIALLESHASREIATADGEAAAGGSGLTLMRMDSWVGEWKLRLRLMSVLVEGSKDAHGGKLVSLIHAHTSNGDPFIRSFTAQILERVSEPFFASLQAWLFDGEVNDPFGEFFVSRGSSSSSSGLQSSQYGIVNPNNNEDGFEGESHRTWLDKWVFRGEMMPSFLEEGFGRKVFSTGKSLNFIRYNCHDVDWVMTQPALSSTSKHLKYSDIPGLEQSIDAAYRLASQRLFDAFFVKYGLMEHLEGLRGYLLGECGDFADLLMEVLSSLLSRPANHLSRHKLTAALVTARKGSTASSSPPLVLDSLDAKMLEYSHGELGWDAFTLTYRISPPLDTVLGPEEMVGYQRLFRFLWGVRRVEGALVGCWGRVVGGARTFLRVPEHMAAWHEVRIMTAEMIHFVRQLHFWCHREVIASSWQELMAFIKKKEGDLDELIAAHSGYLRRMLKKVLLESGRTRGEENYLNQVQGIFAVILLFISATEDFYRCTIAEASRRDLIKDSDRGVYTGDPDPRRSHAAAIESSTDIIHRVKGYGHEFATKTATLVQGLNSHPDLDVRFLATSLASFVGLYQARREHPRA